MITEWLPRTEAGTIFASPSEKDFNSGTDESITGSPGPLRALAIRDFVFSGTGHRASACSHHKMREDALRCSSVA